VIGEVDGLNALIFDDIIDTGGTLVHAAAAIKERGALSVRACATHAVFSGKALEHINESVLDEVVVSNSIPLSEEAAACGKIKALSVAPLVGEAIRRRYPMELQTITAEMRKTSGKGAAGRTRREGNVPAVLYGGEGEPVSIKLNGRDFASFMANLTGEMAVVQLDVQDSPEYNSPALLKSLQWHPTKHEVTHVDFVRIRLDERITSTVQLELVGRPKGVAEEGGILDQHMREVEIECLALDIPEVIEVDVSELGLGDTLHADAIQVPESVTLLTDPEYAVASVAIPRMPEEEAEGEEAEEGAEGVEGAEAEGEEGEEGEEG
jgi:large subunit ribosomal protein L25